MANELLDKIHEEIGLGGDKVVRDAAGKIIGEVKAHVVRGPGGQLIGTVEDASEVDAGPSAHDLLVAGFRQVADAAQLEIPPIVEELTRYARETRTLLDKQSQWDFATRMKNAARLAELQAKYDEGFGKIQEIRNKVRLSGGEAFIKPFLVVVDAHLANMKRHFTEEPLSSLNRF